MEKEELHKRIKYLKVAMSIVVLSLTAFFMTVFFSAPVHADTKEEMDKAKQEKEEKEEELNAAQQNLANTQGTLSVLEAEKDTYQGQMYLLNERMQLVADELAVIEAKMALKQLEIDDTRQQLTEAREDAADQYEAMKQRIVWFYEEGESSFVELLVSGRKFSELLNYAAYFEQIQRYDREKLEEYIATGDAIAMQEAELTVQLEELSAMREEIVAKQQEVNGYISATAQQIAVIADTVAATEAAEKAYMEECDRKAEEVAAADTEYQALKAQYEKELAESRAAQLAAKRDVSSVVFEEGDEYLLANLIFCEVGCYDYEGQLAVGAVVMNRLLSSRYPDTITGVIYARYQFSPVLDGHLASALANDKAQANDGSCYKAARAAMAGETNVGNCYYFRTPIEGLEGIRIGGHIYY